MDAGSSILVMRLCLVQGFGVGGRKCSNCLAATVRLLKGWCGNENGYCGGPEQVPICWSQVPGIDIVSDTFVGVLQTAADAGMPWDAPSDGSNRGPPSQLCRRGFSPCDP